MGCDWSGFFVEGLGFGVGLSNILGDGAFSLSVGDCAPEMLSQLTPREARIFSRQTSASTTAHDFHAILHKRPGSDFTLTPSRRAAADLVVGRMMTESVNYPCAKAGRWSMLMKSGSLHTGTGLSFEQAGIDPSKYASCLNLLIQLSLILRKCLRHLLHRQQPLSLTRSHDLFPSLNGSVARAGTSCSMRTGLPLTEATPWNCAYAPISLRGNLEQKILTQSLSSMHESFFECSNDGNRLEQNARHLLPAVRWEKRELSRRELREFYHNASAFVLPTRGEGWCLPAVEAMSMALPVIVTNFSGPSAYIRPGHAYSIGVAAALNKDGTAEPLITDLVASFRRVAARPREASMVGVRARRWVKAHLSTEVVAL